MKHSILLALIGISATAFAAESEVAALEKRALAGDAAAQNNLGVRFQSGDGVPKDLKKALGFYQQAAVAGHAIVAYNLAFMYDMGVEAPKDRKIANQWYQKAAEQGYAPAMLNLGMNLASGEGAPQDFCNSTIALKLRLSSRNDPEEIPSNKWIRCHYISQILG